MDGFILSFIRTVYSKSEDAEEMSHYHSPLIPSNVCEGQPGGYGQDCSPCAGNMNGAFLNAWREYGRVWRVQFNSFDNQSKALKGLCSG
jgi:hypothetical protein